MPTSDASLRRIQNRRAAFILHSRYDSRELTSAARQAFEHSFLLKVDPDGALDPTERERRAEQARRAHFQVMAQRSVEVRKRKRAALDGELDEL
jgi:hypothetical protein